MVTGAYNTNSCTQFPEILEADEDGITGRVECAHLFSESAQDGDKVIFLLCLAWLYF